MIGWVVVVEQEGEEEEDNADYISRGGIRRRLRAACVPACVSACVPACVPAVDVSFFHSNCDHLLYVCDDGFIILLVKYFSIFIYDCWYDFSMLTYSFGSR